MPRQRLEEWSPIHQHYECDDCRFVIIFRCTGIRCHHFENSERRTSKWRTWRIIKGKRNTESPAGCAENVVPVSCVTCLSSPFTWRHYFTWPLSFVTSCRSVYRVLLTLSTECPLGWEEYVIVLTIKLCRINKVDLVLLLLPHQKVTRLFHL